MQVPVVSDVQGGVPEWLKGTGCKPVSFAYVGSNPTPTTICFYEPFSGLLDAVGLYRISGLSWSTTRSA